MSVRCASVLLKYFTSEERNEIYIIEIIIPLRLCITLYKYFCLKCVVVCYKTTKWLLIECTFFVCDVGTNDAV